MMLDLVDGDLYQLTQIDAIEGLQSEDVHWIGHACSVLRVQRPKDLPIAATTKRREFSLGDLLFEVIGGGGRMRIVEPSSPRKEGERCVVGSKY